MGSLFIKKCENESFCNLPKAIHWADLIELHNVINVSYFYEEDVLKNYNKKW